MTKQYLHNLEHDVVFKPDPSRLALIANALNVSMEWLTTGRGSPARARANGAPDPADLLLEYAKLPPAQQIKMLETIKRLQQKPPKKK